MSIKELLNIPELSKNVREKMSNYSQDNILSHRLYIGQSGGESVHALRSDLAMSIWTDSPQIIFWNSTGFDSILNNYEKSEYYLPSYQREKSFFEYLENKVINSNETYVVVINLAETYFENYKGLFEILEKTKKSNMFFWINTHKIGEYIPKDKFFINAFKNLYNEELCQLIPNHKCSKISHNPDDRGKCYTSENKFKIYQNFSYHEIMDIIITSKEYL